MKKAVLTMVNTAYGELVFHGDGKTLIADGTAGPMYDTDTIVRAESDVPQFFTIEEAQVVCGGQYELTVEWRAVERFMEQTVGDDWRLILVLDSDEFPIRGPNGLTDLLSTQNDVSRVPNKPSRFVDEIPDDTLTKVVVKDDTEFPY